MLWEYISYVIRKINNSTAQLGWATHLEGITALQTAQRAAAAVTSGPPLLYISDTFVPHFCYLLTPFVLAKVDLPACYSSCFPEASSPGCQQAPMHVEHGNTDISI